MNHPLRWRDHHGELHRAAPEIDAWVDTHSTILDRLAELTPDKPPCLFWGYGLFMVPDVMLRGNPPGSSFLYSHKPRGLALCRAGHEPDLDLLQRGIDRYERDDGMVILVVDRDA